MNADNALPEHNLDAARAAKKKARDIYSAYGSVSGIGLAWIDGRMGIKVNFEAPLSGDQPPPSAIDGVPVIISIVGVVQGRGTDIR